MGYQNQEWAAAEVWALVRSQSGVVSRAQLIQLGISPRAIKHRLQTGRLHRIHRGVYAVGRPELPREGLLLAAVLACGTEAALSHSSGADLWGIRPKGGGPIEVTATTERRHPGVLVHRRSLPTEALTTHRAIPVTTPARTLLDIAPRLRDAQLEAAVNEADKLDLIDPDALRVALDGFAGRPGVVALRRVLDRHTFTLTDSALERRFKPIARAAGLPEPLTQQWVNGFRVDFFWPDLGLVVETDGLRYHRTPAQQARAHVRDQRHLAAGLLPLRFTHAQVAYERPYVEATLRDLAGRLTRGRERRSSSGEGGRSPR